MNANEKELAFMGVNSRFKKWASILSAAPYRLTKAKIRKTKNFDS
jgi:hypothetical protein